jgi:hypothetical protein
MNGKIFVQGKIITKNAHMGWVRSLKICFLENHWARRAQICMKASLLVRIQACTGYGPQGREGPQEGKQFLHVYIGIRIF